MQTETRKPLNWFRYIDDIFFVWTHGEDSLHKFMSNLNKFNKHIKITYDFSKEHIPFLDLNVSLAEGKLFFDLYIKSTDCHQYLHYTSSHPEHTKRSIVYSQTLRISKICSLEKDFQNHSSQLRHWFFQRGYPEKIVDTEMKKVKFSNNRKKQL